MELRKLTINDYEDLISLWIASKLPFKPRGRDNKGAIAAQIKANPDFFLGAFEGNRLVGVAVLSSDIRKGWINRLAIDPACRRRGIAKALIAESERVLRKHGVKIFCALIEEYNVTSKKLFKKCGYVEHNDITYFSKRDTEEV
jgi:ribosomal protein S18 acetylase RimI-like enzyme